MYNEKLKIKWIVALVLTYVCALQAFGGEVRQLPDSLSTEIQQVSAVRKTRCIIHPLYFHYDDDVVDMSYMGNEEVMRAFRHTIDSVGLSHVDSIRVVVQSSPEGSYSYNCDLSNRRAINTERYLSKRYPDIMPVTKVVADGESWQALRRYIVTDSVLSAKDISLLVGIIDNISDMKLRKQKLRATGSLFQYLYKTYYPKLRNSIIATVFTTDIITQVRVPVTPSPEVAPPAEVSPEVLPPVVIRPERLRPDTIFIRDTVYVQRQTFIVDPIGFTLGGKRESDFVDPMLTDTIPHDPLFALKTNMLFDVVTALNGELEIPIGRRQSLLAEVVWPWWLQKSHNRWCFEMGSGSLEYRLWFRSWKRHKTWSEWKQTRRQPFRGGFIGVYAGCGYYDFQWKRHNGYQGEFYSAGLTLGVSRYISRFVRLEFSVGGGYVQNKYRTYHIDDNTPTNPEADQHLYRDGRFRNNWIGPTKAKISLSILLHKKCKKKEGGEQ